MKLNIKLAKTIWLLRNTEVDQDRKKVLKPLIEYIQNNASSNNEVLLHFICTHNSRRSQFAQVWAQVAASYFGVKARCFSGGVEVTAFNERAVETLKKAGFEISSKGKNNPTYTVSFSTEVEPIFMFSKLYNEKSNPINNFAAVMTCSHADKNCPIISGTKQKISVMYKDPKAFDNTPEESFKYEEKSFQIANEMFYVFSQITA